MSSQVVVPKPHPVPGMETYREKATRKFKENPWVPLGSMATVGALVVAMVKMKRGQSKSFNQWLRVRVAAQGLTIVAIVAGTYSLRSKDAAAHMEDPTLTRNDMDVERRRMEKVAREKDEFQERLRGAEEAHGLEAELRAKRLGSKGLEKETVGATVESVESASVTSAGVWTSWFGWGKGSSSSPTSSNSNPHRPPPDSTTKP